MFAKSPPIFVLCTASQIIGGDFAKFCGLLRIYELYLKPLSLIKRDYYIVPSPFTVLVATF